MPSPAGMDHAFLIDRPVTDGVATSRAPGSIVLEPLMELFNGGARHDSFGGPGCHGHGAGLWAPHRLNNPGVVLQSRPSAAPAPPPDIRVRAELAQTARGWAAGRFVVEIDGLASGRERRPEARS
jgi:hypothetical protein